MKKIYSIMLALLATLCVGTVSAQTSDTVSFILDVDNAAAIEVLHSPNYGFTFDTIKVVDGQNTLKLGMGDYGFGALYVNAKEGFGIASIESDGDPDDYSLPIFEPNNGSQWIMYPNVGAEGLTYTVVTFDYSSVRTDSVLVWVDQSSKVLFQYYNGGKITLKDSTWKVVYYSPDEEVGDFPFSLNSVSYNVPLYRVLHNGNKLELTEGFRGQYYYDLSVLESGDSLQILANAPADVTFPVIFNFNADSIRSEVDSLHVNGVTVDLKDTIDVPWGQVVQIWFDAENNSVSVNDNVLSKYNNSHQQTITDTTVLNIEIVPFKDFDITLVAHNVTCFYVQNAATYGVNYELKEGENTITVNSGANQIYIDKNKDCLIDSVLVNGVNTSSYSRIYCAENMTIEVFADSIKRDSVMMLYVDDVDNYSYISVQNQNYENMISGTIPSGYTQVKFAAIDNSFNISAYVKNPNSVSPAPKAVYYLNDSIFEPASSYSSYCSPTFAYGDVFKIFADTADVYTVDFVFNGEATTSKVTKDRIVAVEETNFTVLQGTEVSFETAETTILVNGEAVESVDGVVTLTISENTTIEVGVKPSIANTAENPYTVTEAIELTKAGVALTDSVYVIGIVDSLQYVAKYKDVNVWVHDSLNRMEFYAMYGFNRDSINSEEDLAALVAVGDTLIAKGTLTYYAKNDIYELNMGCYAIEVRKAAAQPEPEPEIAQYQLHGSWVENWGGPVLEIAEDKATASATVELKEGNYNFGIRQIDADGAQIAWLWTANTEGDTFTREANAFTFIKQETIDEKDNGKNPTLAADVDGVYTFVWTYADNTLTITFPAKPEGIFNATVEGQAEKFVRDGQLIIRMNGVEYNVLGAKLQ
ncbi:MAG: hypothetical protein ACI30J_08365 [Paludibacteraceae bacterium]